MTDEVTLQIDCGGMINGKVLTAKGTGKGSVEKGTLGIDLDFSEIPDGFSIFCASLWTACCSTPTFALEVDGGVNMMTLSGGRYRCDRTFDFGIYGSYVYNYEIRLDEETQTMRADGVIHGSLSLPKIVDVQHSFTEMMIPVGGKLVRSFSETEFVAEDGEKIPVLVEGRYSPLADDAQDWHCCARNQIRKSFINILDAEGTHLQLIYSTVINGVREPVLPTAAT